MWKIVTESMDVTLALAATPDPRRHPFDTRPVTGVTSRYLCTVSRPGCDLEGAGTAVRPSSGRDGDGESSWRREHLSRPTVRTRGVDRSPSNFGVLCDCDTPSPRFHRTHDHCGSHHAHRGIATAATRRSPSRCGHALPPSDVQEVRCCRQSTSTVRRPPTAPGSRRSL